MDAFLTHPRSRRLLSALLALLLAFALMQLGLMLASQKTAADTPLDTWYLAEGSNRSSVMASYTTSSD
jgi:hypothetical protein